jgi:hypothetical protein
MANRRILSLAVVACLFAIASYAFATDYWTYTKADVGGGFPFDVVTPQAPATAPNWETVGTAQFPGLPTSQLNSTVYTSPGDSTYSILLDYNNPVTSEPTMRVQGFSYSADIPTWLGSANKTLLYSVEKSFNPSMTGIPGIPSALDANQYGMASTVIAINGNGAESLVKHMTTEGGTDANSMGLSNMGANGSSYQVISDFSVTNAAVDANKTQYLTSGKSGAYQFGGGMLSSTTGYVSWGANGANRGSGQSGKASPGDVMLRQVDLSDPENPLIKYNYFAKAWQIAGILLGYDWTATNTKWDNATGNVVNATTNAKVTGDGADTVRNFLRYVMAIQGLVVYDAVDNGASYSSSTDAILFSLVGDNYYTKGMMWGDTGPEAIQVSTPFAGQYFRGDVVFLYQGTTITTYFDPQNDIFFGQHISTGDTRYYNTIWNNQKGLYHLGGLDISYALDGDIPPGPVPIPEPSTIILIIGSALALGAGIIRKRVR